MILLTFVLFEGKGGDTARSFFETADVLLRNICHFGSGDCDVVWPGVNSGVYLRVQFELNRNTIHKHAKDQEGVVAKTEIFFMQRLCTRSNRRAAVHCSRNMQQSTVWD